MLAGFSNSDIGKEDEKNSDRDKYIRKIQDCKVFHSNKIHNISNKNTLIRMRQGSSYNEHVPRIEKSRFFRIFDMGILIEHSENEENSDSLKEETMKGKGECYSCII